MQNKEEPSKVSKPNEESTNAVNLADDEKQKSFREQAIEAYEKDKARQEQIKKGNPEAFRRKAEKAFFELFDIATTGSEDIDGHRAIVHVGNQKFAARKAKYGDCIFHTIVNCTLCKKELILHDTVEELKEVGRDLSGKYLCDECKEKEREEEPIFQSTADLVLEKVREIFDLLKEE